MINNHMMGNGADSELPQEVLAVLPTDPYEQLDVAKKITALAVASRVSKLEAEAGKLRQKLAEKEHIIYGLQERIGELEQTLQETTARLSHSLDEQSKLTSEKNLLVASVKKLNRDVAKLETFKRTLMQSLQEDEENPSQLEGVEKLSAHRLSALSSLSSNSSLRDTDISISRAQSMEDDRSVAVGSARGSSSDNLSSREEEVDVDASKHGTHQSFPLTPHLTPPHLTPQLTPTGSPKRQSAAGSPRRQSAGGSPRRHSASGSPKRLSAGEGRVSLPSSHPTSHHSTAPNSPPHTGSLPARTPRVDGKEFFRQARNRLSYEQFSAFLANIKELNAHRQSREETLRKADEIFGPDNKDLYMAFEGLLSRHLPAQGR